MLSCLDTPSPAIYIHVSSSSAQRDTRLIPKEIPFNLKAKLHTQCSHSTCSSKHQNYYILQQNTQTCIIYQTLNDAKDNLS